MSVACEAPPVAEEASRVRRRGQKFQGECRRNFWAPQERRLREQTQGGDPHFLWRLPPSLSAERDGGNIQKLKMWNTGRRGRRSLRFSPHPSLPCGKSTFPRGEGFAAGSRSSWRKGRLARCSRRDSPAPAPYPVRCFAHWARSQATPRPTVK